MSRWRMGIWGLALTLVACGDAGADDASGGRGGAATATSVAASGVASGTTSASTTSSSTSASSSATGSGGSGGSGGTADPNVDGPYAIAELDDQFVAPATGHSVPVHAAYPSGGPTGGPFPVVVIAHGFQLPASQYYGYARRLASFGYVALAPDYPASLFSVNNVDNAKDLLAAVDWASSAPPLAAVADATNVGMTGHSMGGKLAILAASMDDRVKATITLDPVDSSMNCNPTDCPDASSLTGGLGIPTGFLGETTDATAGGFGQACAPAADNFTTFYDAAGSPSIEIDVAGANHMSFLDDVASCGFVCGFCNAATASNSNVNALAKAMVTAFYERYLRGETAYDTYLTGTEAQSRYVSTGEATIVAK